MRFCRKGKPILFQSTAVRPVQIIAESYLHRKQKGLGLTPEHRQWPVPWATVAEEGWQDRESIWSVTASVLSRHRAYQDHSQYRNQHIRSSNIQNLPWRESHCQEHHTDDLRSKMQERLTRNRRMRDVPHPRLKKQAIAIPYSILPRCLSSLHFHAATSFSVQLWVSPTRIPINLLLAECRHRSINPGTAASRFSPVLHRVSYARI